MSEWTWKHRAGYALVAFVVWLISYTVEWNIRTGGEVYWGDAIFAWWGDVVMLHWVKDYQTLLAGILAFGAGAFVWISYRAQRDDAARDTATALRQSRSDDLADLRQQIMSFHSNFITTASDFDEEIRAIRGATRRVSRFAPRLARWVDFVCDQIREYWLAQHLDHDPSTDPPKEQHGKMKAYRLSALLMTYFEDAERMLNADGEYQHVPAKRSGLGVANPDEFDCVEGRFVD